MHSIDIGNEGSAFIEVLVGNSSAVRDQDYEVFLENQNISLPNHLHLSLLHIFNLLFNLSLFVLGSVGYVFLHVPHGEP